LPIYFPRCVAFDRRHALRGSGHGRRRALAATLAYHLAWNHARYRRSAHSASRYFIVGWLRADSAATRCGRRPSGGGAGYLCLLPRRDRRAVGGECGGGSHQRTCRYAHRRRRESNGEGHGSARNVRLMTAHVRSPWMEKPTLAGRALKALTIGIIVVLALYPFFAVVGTSLATEAEISARGGLLLVPWQPTLEAYRSMFEGGVVTRAMLVSIAITLVGTLLSVGATIGLAYATSRPIVGGRALLFMAVFTLLFVPGIIPSFLVVKELGLLNSYASLVLPVMVSAFNLVVLRQFFMGIPGEIIDAARIDGAGDLRILTTIVLPLSKAAIAIIALFYGVAYWNAFFNALLYINDSDKWPLQLIVRQYVVNGAPLASAGAGDVLPPARAVQMAVVVTAMIPILLAYPFLQRYFTRGVLSGAIKT